MFREAYSNRSTKTEDQRKDLVYLARDTHDEKEPYFAEFMSYLYLIKT
jgi:hypothetical protein